MTSPEERKGHNQAAFREANERIEGTASDLVGDNRRRTVPFLCECPERDCRQIVLVTLEEYERVRADGTHGIEALGHDDAAVERVIEQNDRFIVTEKFGPAAATVLRTDPRAGNDT